MTDSKAKTPECQLRGFCFGMMLVFVIGNPFRRYRDTDPIYFHMFIDRDHQSLSSVDDPCFYQIGGFWIDFYHYIWCLDVEFSGACDIRS